MQTINTVTIPGDNIDQLRHMLLDMVRGRYKHCHGLTLAHDTMDTLESSDLATLLIDRFADRLSYRSRHCFNVMDTGQEDVSRDSCPQCRILSSMLLDKYSTLAAEKSEETPRRRGRPRESRNRVKEVQFPEDEQDFDTDLVIDNQQSQSSIKDESGEVKCDQTGSSQLEIDEDRNVEAEEYSVNSLMNVEEEKTVGYIHHYPTHAHN